MQRRIVAMLSALAVLVVVPAYAQSVDTNRFQATRRELQELLAKYEQSARSGAYSPELRARAKYEASLIKQRLDRGDYQVGDRIAVIVDGEPTLSDTLVVGSDTTVVLPTGERIGLQRVLRSEVQERMQLAIAKVVKQPVVHTESFLRIGILGAVGTQGFYVVRSDALLTDVLMSAGGPQQTADLSKMRIERDRRKIWEGEPLQAAITEGRTVDQLSLRAGDMLVVPASSSGSARGTLTTIRSIIFAIPALYGLLRILGV